MLITLNLIKTTPNSNKYSFTDKKSIMVTVYQRKKFKSVLEGNDVKMVAETPQSIEVEIKE